MWLHLGRSISALILKEIPQTASSRLGFLLAKQGYDCDREKPPFGELFSHFGLGPAWAKGKNIRNLTLARPWPGLGPALARLWPGLGPALARLWPGFGPALARLSPKRTARKQTAGKKC